jgi:hypothetical protein
MNKEYFWPVFENKRPANGKWESPVSYQLIFLAKELFSKQVRWYASCLNAGLLFWVKAMKQEGDGVSKN